MSFHQKTITVSLVNFTLILGFYLIRVFQMFREESFTPTNVFGLWGIVIVLAVVVTVLATILTQIVSGILDAIKTNTKPNIQDLKDERDTSIDLRGTKITYLASSIGVFLAMLTFAIGQPPLVMFTLLILSGVVAQIIGDATRLYLYKRGF